MKNIASLTLISAIVAVILFFPTYLRAQIPGSSPYSTRVESASRQTNGNTQRQVQIHSQPVNSDKLSRDQASSDQEASNSWLNKNALALIALLVAILGGLPGVLKILQYFQPISLKGSIKFYAPTSGDNPPRDGILVALTLVNQGSKELVWRRIKAQLRIGEDRISLEPVLITHAQAFANVCPWENDLLKQQVVAPGVPMNGYLHFLAPKGSIGTGFVSPSCLDLLFESESGRGFRVKLRFVGNHPLNENESFPTHGVSF